MKEAIGKYVCVRAITREEAIALTDELFVAEGHKLFAEGHKLFAEGRKLYAEIVIKQRAFMPDRRALNFIATDRDNGVYCFVWSREEIWFYNGEDCPDPKTVEVIWSRSKEMG